jgi:acetyl-CoA decarbonylase/synthase, CODH/ACS complex subunit beta
MHHMSNAGYNTGSQQPGFEKLLSILPHEAGDFKGTEFGQPAAVAYSGKRANAENLRSQAEALRMTSPPQMCEVAMVMAEMIAAAAPDNDKYFQTDAQTRGHVFWGSKWRSGWVFVMGGTDHSELVEIFKKRDFLVFVQNGANLENTVDLGPRETAAVYFLQVMARYAMIWGGIKPGDDHEMGHFLERDMPGVVVADGKLTPTEELLLLALMKMGAPAVVSNNYPWDLGNQVRAEGTDKIVEAAISFPNLRVKEIQGKVIDLPAHCNRANITTTFEAESSVGGVSSFFVLKPSAVQEGIELPQNDDLSKADSIGIMIEIGDKRLDVSTSDFLEKDALKGISTIKGLRAVQTHGKGFLIQFEHGVEISAARIAEALSRWLPYEFPYLEKIHIRILTGEEAKKARSGVDEFRATRKKVIVEESDDNVTQFHYCLECQPFAKDHVCIITPDRPPMCGRDRLMQKAAALFGVSMHPWKRRELEAKEIRGTIQIKHVIDASKGEYAEVNQAIERLSPSHIQRVQIHGLREFPHTSCGCFQFLVFWIESLSGMGIMERDYPGVSPEGFTWDKLANAAGGKQAPGIVGVSRNYLRSRRFLQGEGGLSEVRWASPRAFEAIKDLLPQPEKVQVGQLY